MRFFLLLFLFSALCVATFAQGRVQGKVFENKTYIAVGGVRVENLKNHAATSTDAAGAFSIVAKAGDLLSFSSLGYKADTLYLKDMDVVSVYLTPEENMLNEVKVKELEFPPGAFSMPVLLGPMGSKTVRYQTDKNGNAIGGIQLSPSALFGGKKTSTAKIERYEKDAEIMKIFNPTALGPYLPITGQELTNFIVLYKPSVETFYDKNFNIASYLNECYRKFMQIPEEKRKSKELIELK